MLIVISGDCGFDHLIKVAHLPGFTPEKLIPFTSATELFLRGTIFWDYAQILLLTPFSPITFSIH